MKTFWAVLIILSQLLVLMACAKQPVLLNQVLVQNSTGGTITDVTILHLPTNRFGAVNAILPGKALDLGLSGKGQPMLAEQAVVHWRDGNGLEWSVALKLPHSQPLAEEKHLACLTYFIYPQGVATVDLREQPSALDDYKGKAP